MIQNRAEWLAWRKQGLGASDVPIVMGKSRHKTRLDLYEEKISDTVEEGSSYITDKGHEMEVKIRSLYEFIAGEDFKEALCVMEDFPFMRASLDGQSADKKTILEIKLLSVIDPRAEGGVNKEAPGYLKWLAAKEGIVPEEYIDQVQAQLLASGADQCVFLGLRQDKSKETISPEDLAIAIVYPDKGRQGQILEECTDFWLNYVSKKKPPIPSERDFKKLTGLNSQANRWKQLKLQIKQLEQELDVVEDMILTAAKENGHPRLKIDDVKISLVSRVGNVNYAKVPELKGVNLDQYRGKGSTYYKMEISGGKKA